MNSKELVEQFLNFETDQKLFDLKPEGVPLWELIRFEVYKDIRNNLSKNSFEVKDINKSSLLNGINEFLRNFYVNSPYRKNNRCDILIINHPRRKLDKIYFEDIYTDELITSFESEYMVLERFFNLRHFRPAKTENLYYLDYLEFPSRFVNHIPFLHSQPMVTNQKISRVENELMKKYSCENLNIIKTATVAYKRYRYLYPRVKKLLNKVAPTKIITTVSYSFINQIFTAVAKELTIPVIELQHGIIGKSHVAYNYKTSEEIITFPDYFFAWGRYWINGTRFPIIKDKVSVVGYPYINKLKTNELKREKKRIIILSQRRKDLAELTVDLALKLPDYEIIFKCHPSEYRVARIEYELFSNYKNVTLLCDDKMSLYDLFKQSTFVIGIYSTAMIEAIKFCPNIIIAKLPGWESLESLQKYKSIKFYDSAHEIASFILNNPNINTNITITDQFFKSNSISNINKLLNNISK